MDEVPEFQALRLMMEKGYPVPLNDNETVMTEDQRPAMADASAWDSSAYAVRIMA